MQTEHTDVPKFLKTRKKLAASPPFLLAPAPTRQAGALNMPTSISTKSSYSESKPPLLGPNLTMVNNSCSLKYALKLVPGLADVGDLHGVGGGPIAPS